MYPMTGAGAASTAAEMSLQAPALRARPRGAGGTKDAAGGWHEVLHDG